MIKKTKKLPLGSLNILLLVLIFQPFQTINGSALRAIKNNPTLKVAIACRLKTTNYKQSELDSQTKKGVGEKKAFLLLSAKNPALGNPYPSLPRLVIAPSREQDIEIPDQNNKSKLFLTMLDNYYLELKVTLKHNFNLKEATVITYDLWETWKALREIDAQTAHNIHQSLLKIRHEVLKKTYLSFAACIDRLDTITLQYGPKLKKQTEQKIQHFVFNAQENDWEKFISCCDLLSDIFKPIAHEYIVSSAQMNLAEVYNEVLKNKNKIPHIIAKADRLCGKLAIQIEVAGKHELIPMFYAIAQKYEELNRYLATNQNIYEKNDSELKYLKQKIDGIKSRIKT